MRYYSQLPGHILGLGLRAETEDLGLSADLRSLVAPPKRGPALVILNFCALGKLKSLHFHDFGLSLSPPLIVHARAHPITADAWDPLKRTPPVTQYGAPYYTVWGRKN